MFRVFTSALSILPPGLHCIMDELGPVYVEKEYIESLGKNAILTGCFYDPKGRLVWTYRHVRRTVTR